MSVLVTFAFALVLPLILSNNHSLCTKTNFYTKKILDNGDSFDSVPVFISHGLTKTKDKVSQKFSAMRSLIVLTCDSEDRDQNSTHSLIMSTLRHSLSKFLPFIDKSQANNLIKRLENIYTRVNEHNPLIAHPKGCNEIELDQYGKMHATISAVSPNDPRKIKEMLSKLNEKARMAQNIDSKKPALVTKRLILSAKQKINNLVKRNKCTRCKSIKFLNRTLKCVYEKGSGQCVFNVDITRLISFLKSYSCACVLPLITIDFLRKLEDKDARFNSKFFLAHLHTTQKGQGSFSKLIVKLTPAIKEIDFYMLQTMQANFQLSSHHMAQQYLHVIYLYSSQPIDGYHVELKDAFLSECTLHNLLTHDLKNSVLTKDDRTLLCLWLIDLVEFLHSQARTVHRNLNLNEIKLDAMSGRLKLINADYSIPLVEKTEKVGDGKGEHMNWIFAAPEHACVLSCAYTLSKISDTKDLLEDGNWASDIWALGCMLHQLSTDLPHPFFSKITDMTCQKLAICAARYINTGEGLPSQWPCLVDNSHEMFTLLKGTLSAKPRQRWNMARIITSSWVEKTRPLFKDKRLSEKAMKAIEKLANLKHIRAGHSRSCAPVTSRFSKGEIKEDNDIKSKSKLLTVSLPNTLESNSRYSKAWQLFSQRLELPDSKGKLKSISEFNRCYLDLAHTDRLSLLLKQFSQLLDIAYDKAPNHQFYLESLGIDPFGQLQLQVRHNHHDSVCGDFWLIDAIKDFVPSVSRQRVSLISVKKDVFDLLLIMLNQSLDLEILLLCSAIINRRKCLPARSTFVAEFALLPQPSKESKSVALLFETFEVTRTRHIPIDIHHAYCLYNGRAKNLYLGSIDNYDSQVVVKQYQLSKFRESNPEDAFSKAVKNALYLTSLSESHYYVAVTFGASVVPLKQGDCDMDLRWEVMEPLGPNLHTLLNDDVIKQILAKNANDREIWTVQLIKILIFIHQKAGLVHRDIKPLNFCIDLFTFLPKLIDFELSKIVKKNHNNDTWIPFDNYPTHGSWGYSAPEENAPSYVEACGGDKMLNLWEGDIWSVGFIIYIIYTELPHPLIKDTCFMTRSKLETVSEEYLQNNVSINEPKSFAEMGPVIDIIRGMLRAQPSKRMTLKQIIETKWWAEMQAKLPAKKLLSPELKTRIIQLATDEFKKRTNWIDTMKEYKLLPKTY